MVRIPAVEYEYPNKKKGITMHMASTNGNHVSYISMVSHPDTNPTRQRFTSVNIVVKESQRSGTKSSC